MLRIKKPKFTHVFTSKPAMLEQVLVGTKCNIIRMPTHVTKHSLVQVQLEDSRIVTVVFYRIELI